MLAQALFAFFSLIFCIKGLGGSFNALFTHIGWDLAHGPTIAACLGISLSGFFVTYAPSKGHLVTFNKKEKTLIYFLFLFPLLLALTQRVWMVMQTPLDIQRADMLFAIRAEIEAFLNGQNPYGPVKMADGREVLHGYPPMLWLSYLPLHVIHADLRLLNIFAQGVFYLFLLDLFLRKKTYWFKTAYADIALFILIFLLHLFSKQATRQPIDVHTGPYWLYWTVFLWLLSRNKIRQSFWLIPLLLLSREPAILFLFPLAILVFLKSKKLFIEAVWKTGLLGLLIAGPLILRDPALYFKGIFFYSHHIYENPFEIMIRFYGFSGVLKWADALWLQKPLQLFGILLALALIFKRKLTLTLSQSLALGGLAYLWLMLFVSLSYPFIYTELIILLYALLLWPTPERDELLSP